MLNNLERRTHPRQGHAHAHTQQGRALLWSMAMIGVVAAGGWWWWQGHSAASHGAPADLVAATRSATAASAPASGAGRGAAGARHFAGANAAQPVSVDTVRQQDVPVSVSAIGSLAASNTAVVRAQVSGVLKSLNFREGQQVQAGQLLAQIDPRAFEATLAQAEGVLGRDKAQLEGARLDLARYRDLLAKDAVPKQQLDTQATLVAQLEGTVKADQGTVDNARLQLSYTRVTAPIAGRVGLKQADLGNATSPNDANGIVSITQTRPMALVFSVPAANVSGITQRLRTHQPLPVQAWERGGSSPLAVGSVAAMDNAIDPGTDTIKVKALFPNADDRLYPNQTVNVVLQLDTVRGALTVPQAAVLRGAQGFYVYRVNDDGTVSARPVTPGAAAGGRVAVQGALQVNDRVVVDGTDRLREGAQVAVIHAGPAR